MYRAEKVLEARNPTVAPPGRRSTRPTTGAPDRNMSVPSPANSNIRKRQVDIQDDGSGDNSSTTRKHQVGADNNDDGHGSPEHQDNNYGSAPRKQQDKDEDTTTFRGRQRERPMLRAGHQSRTPSYSHDKGIFFSVSHCL
jgi:hypothetical protein